MWLAFGSLHAWLAYLNLPQVTYTYGDVLYVYTSWAERAAYGDIVGITSPWVYPLLAWLPIAASNVLGPEALPVVWAVLVTALNAVGFAMLMRIPRGTVLAWTWLAIMLASGPIAMARIDAIAAAVALIGFAVLRGGPQSDRRTFVAAALFTVGAWVKVWPGALWLALLVARPRRLMTLAGGMLVSGAVIVAAMLLGSSWVWSFLTEQSDRGLQIEAVAATPFMWSAALGGDATVIYDRVLLTNQVYSSAAFAVAALATPLLVAAAAFTAALGVIAVRRVGEAATVTWLALALVSALIVFNKVGSPQFIVWLIVPALLLASEGGRKQWGLVGAIIAVALLTQLQFPWTYHLLVNSQVPGVVLLTLRNALHVLLFATAFWALARLALSRRSRPSASAQHSAEDLSDALLLDEEGVVPEGAIKNDR